MVEAYTFLSLSTMVRSAPTVEKDLALPSQGNCVPQKQEKGPLQLSQLKQSSCYPFRRTARRQWFSQHNK